MKITMEQMVDAIIMKYGFEHRRTIKFCTLVEQGTDDKEVREVFKKYIEA